MYQDWSEVPLGTYYGRSGASATLNGSHSSGPPGDVTAGSITNSDANHVGGGTSSITSSSSAAGNVLQHFHRETARLVVVNVLPELAESLSGGDGTELDDKDERYIQWCSEIICHGLTLSFTNPAEYKVVNQCVVVYLDWLTALTAAPSPKVPKPILGAPLVYTDTILDHLLNLFESRRENIEGLLYQAKECHNVLRRIESVARGCRADLKQEVATRFIKFALVLADRLLSPPNIHEDLSEQLSSRVISFVFNVWCWAASIHQFPTPGYWKTFANRAHGWRHRVALVEQWVVALQDLTNRVLHDLYGREMPNTSKAKDSFVCEIADKKTVLHVWFRFLFLIYRPKDLLICMAGADSSPMACQVANFYNCIRGISGLVDKCLGHSTEFRGPAWYLGLPDVRPSVDALLELLGDYLLSSAILSADSYDLKDHRGSQNSVRSSGSGSLDESSTSFRGRLNKFSSTYAEFQAGRAEAYAVLCKILCSKKSGEEIREDLLARMYACLMEAFSKREPEVLRSIVTHAQTIFYMDFPAVHLLVPETVKGLGTLLNQKPDARDVAALLSRACLTMVGGIICYPTLYDLRDSRAFLEKLLLSFVKTEQDALNLQMGYGLLVILCFDQKLISDSPKSLESLITLVAKEFCRGLLQWISVHPVSFSLLDGLSSLTHLQPQAVLSNSTCFTIITALCEFINSQLERPRTEHSRDLHSLIVSAYICLCRWFCAVPTLLGKPEILTLVLEVLEKGLTGNLARPSAANPEILVNPASKRVGDAAEQLLATLCAQTLWHEPSPVVATEDSRATSTSYFVLDESVLLAVRVNPQNDGVSSDRLTINSGAGSFMCDIELRMLVEQAADRSIWDRKFGGFVPTVKAPKVEQVFPPETDKYLACKADFSIPPLKCTPAAESLRTAFHEAVQNEKWAATRLENPPVVEVKPPSPTSKVHVARLLLTSLGGSTASDASCQRLKILDSAAMDFETDLRALEAMSTRVIVTCHAFYVKQGIEKISDILSSGSDYKKTCSAFVRFLSRLGRVAPRSDCSDIEELKVNDANPSHVGQLDGVDSLLVWQDWMTELRVFVPSGRILSANQARDRAQTTPKEPVEKRLSAMPLGLGPVPPPRSKSISHEAPSPLELSQSSGMFRSSKSTRTGQFGPNWLQSFGLFVVWLERFEDYDKFPIDEAVKAVHNPDTHPTSPDFPVVLLFVHPIAEGLYRIKRVVHPSTVKLHVSIPVSEGCVVNESTLGCVVRETLLNIAWRKRLEQEGWVLPQIKRKQKIQELSRKFAMNLSPNEQLYHLITTT